MTALSSVTVTDSVVLPDWPAMAARVRLLLSV